MATETTEVTEARRVRIWALAQTLNSHGYAVEMAESDPLLSVPAAFGSPVVVRCDQRAVCGGELWFAFPGGGAIAPADDAHMADVVVAVKGRLATQTGG